MSVTKLKKGLSKAEWTELNALKDRRLDVYFGYNVTRHFFTEKPDAERFLQLIIKDGADLPVFYGSACAFSVTRSNWKGPNSCWEVSEG